MNTETHATSVSAPQVRRWAVPAIDVLEKNGDYQVIVDLPGVQLDGIDLSVDQGALILTATRHDQPDRGLRRVLKLPEEVDAERVTAELKHGVLRLDLPRAERHKPRSIQVRG